MSIPSLVPNNVSPDTATRRSLSLLLSVRVIRRCSPALFLIFDGIIPSPPWATHFMQPVPVSTIKASASAKAERPLNRDRSEMTTGTSNRPNNVFIAPPVGRNDQTITMSARYVGLRSG